jgi:pyridoxamine 5'-phosphate oxidase
MLMELADLRRDYSLRELSKSSVDPNPIEQFSVWMTEALDSAVLEPTAMTASTVDADEKPSARVVLLKGFDNEGFVFFTNYESRKGSNLAANPNISLHFFWPDLERQIIVNGTAEKVARDRSEAYFASRPLGSQIGAWASKQSSVLENREELEQRVAEVRDRFAGGEIPCPPFWGGYRVTPTRVEFWQGRKSRLHDRIVYEYNDGSWTISRLSP